MASARRAIAWELWRKNAFGLRALYAVVLFFCLATLGCAAWLRTPVHHLLNHALVLAHPDLAGWSLLTGFLAMGASLMALLVMLSFTEPNPEGVEGFPSRMFHLPVRSWFLAGWPMCLAILAMTGLYCAWAIFVFRPVGIRLPFVLPLVSLAGAMAALQTLVWSFPTLRAVKLWFIAVILFGLMALNAWEVSTLNLPEVALPWLRHLMPSWPDGQILFYNRVSLGLALATVLAAFPLAVSAIDRRRHGRFWRQPGRALGRSAREHVSSSKAWRSFRSPAQAQLWFEWRRNGLILPWCVVLGMALMLGPIPWLTGMDQDSISVFMWILFLLPIALAVIVGKGFAKLDLWARGFSMSSFQAVRPMRSDTLIFTKLKVAAASSLTAWAVLLLLVPVWLGLWGGGNALVGLGGELFQDYSPVRSGAVLLLAVASGIILTWTYMVSALFIGVWGRPGAFIGAVLLSLLIHASAVYFGSWLLSEYEAESGYRVFISLPWILGALGVAFVLKMAAACWAFITAYDRGALSGKAVRDYLIIWAVATALLIAFPLLALPYPDWLRHLLALGACLVVPLTRIALAPMALISNRRRR